MKQQQIPIEIDNDKWNNKKPKTQFQNLKIGTVLG